MACHVCLSSSGRPITCDRLQYHRNFNKPTRTREYGLEAGSVTLLLAARCDPRCRILSDVPDKISVHRMNSCRRKIGRCAEDFLYSVSFAAACHQEPNV